MPIDNKTIKTNPRYFLALNINNKIANFLDQKTQNEYLLNTNKQSRINKTLSGNHHITLLYIGQSSTQSIVYLIDQIENYIKRNPSVRLFDYQIHSIGTFPNKQPRFISAQVYINRLGIQIREKLIQVCQRCNIKFDQKKFIPHITLAQIKQPIHQHQLKLKPIIQCHAKSFELYQSPANGDPNRLYQSIHTFKLHQTAIDH